MPVISHLVYYRIPFVKLSDDSKLMRVHFNVGMTDEYFEEPNIDVVFFINLETMQVKFFDFKGVINVESDNENPLLKYKYSLLTDHDSFVSTHCIFRRRLRSHRVEDTRKKPSKNTKFKNLKCVELVKLNLQNMTLGKKIISRINEQESFISL